MFEKLDPLLYLEVLFALLLGCAQAFAGSAVTVKPLRSPPGEIVYPRLVAGASAEVRREVNKVLASREKADRQQRLDCLDAVRQAGQTPVLDSFEETVTASYVSARYLSVDVRQSYFCATAYPTDDAADPLTIDLANGKALDWNGLFKPDFLPRERAAGPSALTRLYQMRYAVSGEQQECKDIVSGQDPFEEGVMLWLDAARGGLVAQPSFPHAIAACAKPITLGSKDLALYAAPDFLRDLTAVQVQAKSACGTGAQDCPITLRMAPGSDTTTVKGAFRKDDDCCAYAFRARSGQVLTWRLAGPAARVTIRYPDGRVDGPMPHRIALPNTGKYILRASPSLMADRSFGRFTLTVDIR
jgi:hypothetical protein